MQDPDIVAAAEMSYTTKTTKAIHAEHADGPPALYSTTQWTE